MESAADWVQIRRWVKQFSRVIIKFCTAKQKLCLKPPSDAAQRKTKKQKGRMRFLLGANAFTLKTTETKSAGRQKAVWLLQPVRSRSHLSESETSAFLSAHRTKTVPGHRFFYEIFYWQGLLKQPPPNTQESHHSPPLACQRRCKPTSPGFNFVFAGRGCEPCRHKQTPVERTWKLTAILAPLSTMHTFSAADTAALTCEHSA